MFWIAEGLSLQFLGRLTTWVVETTAMAPSLALAQTIEPRAATPLASQAVRIRLRWRPGPACPNHEQ